MNISSCKILCKSLMLLSIMGIILPSIGFAQLDESVSQLPQMPETFEEAKSFVILAIKGLPEAVRQSWQEAKEIWQQTWVKWWNEHIKSWLQNIWQTIKGFINTIIEKVRIFLGQEIEKRKPFVEQEFGKEKQEMREEIEKEIPSLWERFKGLIKTDGGT